jgi:hypothetical protein
MTTALIWGGAGLTAMGIAGLIACIVMAARARAAGLTGAAMQARLRQIVAWNAGALAVSGLGLMCVVLGVMLQP